MPKMFLQDYDLQKTLFGPNHLLGRNSFSANLILGVYCTPRSNSSNIMVKGEARGVGGMRMRAQQRKLRLRQKPRLRRKTTTTQAWTYMIYITAPRGCSCPCLLEADHVNTSVTTLLLDGFGSARRVQAILFVFLSVAITEREDVDRCNRKMDGGACDTCTRRMNVADC